MSGDNTNYEIIDFHDHLFYDYDKIKYRGHECYRIPEDLESFGKDYKNKDVYHLDELSIVYKFIKIYYLYGKHNFYDSKIFKFTLNELAKKVLEIIGYFKDKAKVDNFLQYRYQFRNTYFNFYESTEWESTHTKFIKEVENFYDIVFKDYKYKGGEINITELNKDGPRRYHIYSRDLGKNIYESAEVIESYVEKYIETKLKKILNDKYFMNYKIINEGETIFKGIKISYDELLEIFKEKKLVTDPEYSMLKSNYEPVNYYNNEVVINDGSLFENIIHDIIGFEYDIRHLSSDVKCFKYGMEGLRDKFMGWIYQLEDEIDGLKEEIENLKENKNTKTNQRKKNTKK